ncbi:metal dependent phosphohydrolase [Pseudobacteroides cellulosolvens ATCC 35603 = DSM 2933]|uniref:Metal dependent phosphohydrolase n=2 Tax=Pseudobacteroides cellulosolvens TaxID=35825 RepID=A0A0L6JSA6_9FIRM|nr:metal dependent phosphohydrolase [Pseudobacteroides cellulosolvens ATCC 35603 = DSM 2933]
MSYLKEYIANFKKHYLTTKLKRVEFICCLGLNFTLTITQPLSSDETRAYVGQFQGFIAVYLAFRFGIVGMLISLAFSIKDMFFITMGYIETKNYAYLVGLIFTFMTLGWVLIVGIISVRQEKHRREMQRLAITDELTDLFNQRYFHTTLENEIKNSSKCGTSIGLILIDIDNFRMYNDLYGHSYGDTILTTTASILKKIVNKDDTVYRFGGDEFAILMLDKNLETLEKEAKHLYDEYEKLKNEYYNDSLVSKITFSIGLSEYPSISSSKEELISHANMALYQSKNMGDDKVHFYQDIMLQIHKSMKSDEEMVGVFKGLLSTIIAKDKYTFGHCERVSSYAVMIAEAMGLELDEIQTILYAGLLHDIGKIELPKSILNKLGRLTSDEFELIRQHPVNSANILEPLSGINNLIDYVIHHHERYDGKGYPDGIAGEDISLGARILCVADSFDAMISDRPYRKSMSIEEAFQELEKCSGSQFDPKIASLFVKIMRNKMSVKYNYKVDTNTALQKQPALQKV